MTAPWRVSIVEDSERNARLSLRASRQGGDESQSQRLARAWPSRSR